MTSKDARKKLIKLKPIILGSSIKVARMGQEAIGALMSFSNRKNERFEKLLFPSFKCGLIIPEDHKDADPEAVIIYLHGGGYVAGGLDYARGYASVLAEITGLRVFFPAYRLAPENKCPAALKDCLSVYRYVTKGLEIPPEKVILCGESAGGGLIYSLCTSLKKLKLPLPCGIVAISPWTDLTMSGSSYIENENNDPSMTRQRLTFFAESYTSDPTDPVCSPLFGDLCGMPPSLIFSGGDEIMLSDAAALHEKLLACGASSRHIIADGLWHAYPLYRLSDRSDDDGLISEFVKECLEHEKNTPLDEA